MPPRRPVHQNTRWAVLRGRRVSTGGKGALFTVATQRRHHLRSRLLKMRHQGRRSRGRRPRTSLKERKEGKGRKWKAREGKGMEGKGKEKRKEGRILKKEREVKLSVIELRFYLKHFNLHIPFLFRGRTEIASIVFAFYCFILLFC